MRLLTFSFLICLVLSPVAQARPPLREVASINDSLLVLGIAHRVRQKCPTISARYLRAVSFLRGIEAEAKALGYTRAEIEAYVDSTPDKNRLRARTKRFFRAKGVDTNDPQSYCAFGRAEIAKSSQIGRLLRAQ
jgi:hypothetical protein